MQFQGISLVPKLHILFQVLNALAHTLVLISSFVKGNPVSIITSIILYPIFVLIGASAIRLSAELAVSVLLIPSLLVNHQAGDQTVVNGNDLQAYGVSAEGGMSTAV